MAEKIVNLLAADTKQQEKTEENLAGLNGKMEEILLSRQQADIDRLNEENASLRQDREQRKTFSNRIFAFMCMYMSVAIIIVFCCGLGYMYLHDNVLIVLLTSTLADVIGVFLFVAKYLFHNKE